MDVQDISEFKYSDKKIDLLLTHKLYSNAYGTVFIHTVFGLLVSIILFSKVDSILLFSWLAILLTNMLVRFLFIKTWLNATKESREHLWMRNMALGTSLMSGALWASTVGFLDFKALPLESLSLSLMVMALAASAAMYSAFFMPAFFLSVVPYLGSQFAYHLMQWSLESIIISLIIMVFGGMLYGQASRLHRTHKKSIIQTLKNEFLITNMQTANQKLAESSRTDFLTNVLNRRSFDEALNRAWTEHKMNQQTICLIMCDIDLFKDFNDTFGHQIGDTVLVRVADNLQQQLRPSDVLFRYGGEEFTVLLHNTTLAEGVLIADTIRHSIMNDPIDIAGSQQGITLSLGVSAQIPVDGCIADSLLKEADHMLFESKRNGRNKVTSAWHHSQEKRASLAE